MEADCCCESIAILIAFGPVRFSETERPGGRTGVRVEWQTDVDQRWDAEADTLRDALENVSIQYTTSEHAPRLIGA